MISSGHCCSYLFRILLGAPGFPCGSLLFLSVSFRSRCFGASNGFVFLRDCLVQLVRKLGFGCLFAASFLFLFCFVYLFRTSLSRIRRNLSSHGTILCKQISSSNIPTLPKFPNCSDRILTCRINSICSPAKVGLIVTDFNYQPGS